MERSHHQLVEQELLRQRKQLSEILCKVAKTVLTQVEKEKHLNSEEAIHKEPSFIHQFPKLILLIINNSKISDLAQL